MATASKYLKPTLPPATARKWRKICESRRWTMTACADALADFFLEKNAAEFAPPAEAQAQTKE